MHPLRVLLVVSVALAAAVAVAFGFTLLRASTSGGVPHIATGVVLVLAVAVFVVFMIPWAAVFVWALRRASDLELLSVRSRRVAEGHVEEVITDRQYHGELDDLARTIEELRSVIEREHASFEEQRTMLNQIVATLGEGIIAVDSHGKVVFANERASEIFGTSGRRLVGRLFLEVTRNQALVRAFDLALTGEASAERLTLQSSSGDRQIETRVFPVGSSSQVAAVALFLEMTELERLQRIRKDFLDDFSHEVRTPLAGLRSAVETFDAGGLTEQQEEQLRHVMLRQLTRIERLVKDLSELNRIESGDLILERQSIDLHEVLRDLCDDFRETAAGTSMSITLRGDVVEARVDIARVQQIFSNLLDNAWKHGGGRGEILVEVQAIGHEAVVSVSDEGEGIPPHEVDRIFHRFYRVDKSRSQNVPGVGLGLAIAKHLALVHGGSIRAFNRAEGGATFEVRLPLDPVDRGVARTA